MNTASALGSQAAIRAVAALDRPSYPRTVSALEAQALSGRIGEVAPPRAISPLEEATAKLAASITHLDDTVKILASRTQSIRVERDTPKPPEGGAVPPAAKCDAILAIDAQTARVATITQAIEWLVDSMQT